MILSDMAPFYEELCTDLKWPVDNSLLAKMQSNNEETFKKLDETLKDAEENLGETEIRDALYAKAEHLCKIGDKVQYSISSYDSVIQNMGWLNWQWKHNVNDRVLEYSNKELHHHILFPIREGGPSILVHLASWFLAHVQAPACLNSNSPLSLSTVCLQVSLGHTSIKYSTVNYHYQ